MFFEILQTAWDQIRAHRLRSTLTGLGIIIGIGTVILIVSVLEGYRSRIETDLNVLGANTFQIQRYAQGGVETGPRRRKPRKKLTPELADAIREHCPSVLRVGIEAWRYGQVVSYEGKRTNPNISVAGGSDAFADLNGYALAEGRFITPRDVRTHARVMVLGSDVVDQLFDRQSPLGQVVRVGGQKFRIIGIFEKQGNATFGQSRDNLVVIPITTYQEIFERQPDIHILVQAVSPALMARAQDEVIAVLRRLRKVPPGKKNDFEIFSNQTLIESFNNVARIIQLGGMALGIISLLVGGIGVMNIMLVSVTERTREIGIRKAVGGRPRDILRQFLMEAVLICLVGGILGMLSGIALAGLIAVSANMPVKVPLWSVLAALGVTSLVGISAGLYPAYKAAYLNVIDALRYE